MNTTQFEGRPFMEPLSAICLSWLLIIPTVHYAQTNVGGVISTNTTWTLSGSPYSMISNILINPGVALTIEPGVEVNFLNTFIRVDGTLRAEGTDTQIIILNMLGGAAGIIFEDTSADYNTSTGQGCLISHCHLNGDTAGTAIKITEASPKISHSIIQWMAQPFLSSVTSAIIEFCTIRHCSYGVFLQNSCDDKPIIFRNNEVYNCALFQIAGNIRVTNNCFHDNSSWFQFFGNCKKDSVIIEDNWFLNNYWIYPVVEFKGNIDSITVSFTGNTFSNNGINFATNCYTVLQPGLKFTFKDNNFYSYVDYHIEFLPGSGCASGDSIIIDLTDNYWNGLTATQIEAAIWDYRDDFSLGFRADWDPKLTFPTPMDSSVCNNQWPIGQLNLQQRDQIMVYPNPTSGVFRISKLPKEVERLKVLNLIGQEVSIPALKAGFETAISVEELPPGYYFLQVDFADERTVLKLIVIR